MLLTNLNFAQLIRYLCREMIEASKKRKRVAAQKEKKAKKENTEQKDV